ncbi:MAG: preprotein translocase subunit SecG [Defluviitaleaceae bacterium]|nr:preprotein translocase subunit SecG [Defluviitaleaceae bacterium]
MSVQYAIVGIIYILGCLALVCAILMQKKRTAGLGSIAGMGNSETYWDKNKKRSAEGSLEKWTKIGGGILFVVSLIISML